MVAKFSVFLVFCGGCKIHTFLQRYENFATAAKNWEICKRCQKIENFPTVAKKLSILHSLQKTDNFATAAKN